MNKFLFITWALLLASCGSSLNDSSPHHSEGEPQASRRTQRCQSWIEPQSLAWAEEEELPIGSESQSLAPKWSHRYLERLRNNELGEEELPRIKIKFVACERLQLQVTIASNLEQTFLTEKYQTLEQSEQPRDLTILLPAALFPPSTLESPEKWLRTITLNAPSVKTLSYSLALQRFERPRSLFATLAFFGDIERAKLDRLEAQLIQHKAHETVPAFFAPMGSFLKNEGVATLEIALDTDPQAPEPECSFESLDHTRYRTPYRRLKTTENTPPLSKYLLPISLETLGDYSLLKSESSTFRCQCRLGTLPLFAFNFSLKLFGR